MARANLLSLFEEFARYSRDIAIVQQRGYRRESFTYGQLAAASSFGANVLREKGVNPGDRVLLWGANSAEWVAAFWSCLCAGAVVVPLDDATQPEFAAKVAAETNARFAFLDRGKLSQLPATLRLPLESFSGTLATQAKNVPRETFECAALQHEIRRADIAEILFTSGTTSEPRGVVLTHGNFLANLEPLEAGIDPYRKYERWLHPIRFLSLVPLSHVFGQFMALLVPPLLGSTVIFENGHNPAEILRSIPRERVTAVVGVPRMLDSLRAALRRDLQASASPEKFEIRLQQAAQQKFLRRVLLFRKLHARLGWKFWAFISGGAALSPETEGFFKSLGYAVVQGYGMTETASLISLSHPFRAVQGSVGKILPGREFRLAPDGEILVRGENVSAGYFEKGTIRTRSEDEGWLRTGDLGELDADGNLRFRGRKKNLIVTPAGLNIYPEDLEAALRAQPGVRDVVVVPVQSGSDTEACAALLLHDTADPTAVLAAANAQLAEYQRVRRWFRWPEADFPRTPTGKPKLAQVTARAQQALAPDAPAAPVTMQPEGSDLLQALEGRSFADLSSLDRVELLSSLEQRYNIELNETQFAAAQSASDIRQLLQEPSARRTDYVYPRWTQTAPVRFLRLVVYYALTWPATLILGHPKIRGLENLRSLAGPALFVANHTTRRADIGLILFALPARFRHRLAAAMGGETLQTFRHPPKEWLCLRRWLNQLSYFLVVSLFNVFPLPQLSGFRESFRFAGETVDRGYSLLVFPEGVINDRDSPGMVPFQHGIGLLAENLQIPVVPIRLDGVWQMKQERRRLARPDEITIHIGAAIRIPTGTQPSEIAARLQALVASL